MASLGITIVILVLVFCVGVPLFMLTAFLLCHYCGEESDSEIPGRNFGQDSDEDNSQSHVRESVHLSATFNQHQVRPPVPNIPIQDSTIEVHVIPNNLRITTDDDDDDDDGLNRQFILESLPTGSIGEKLLIDNPGLECSICLAEYSVADIVRRLPCTHAFHVHCIDQWLNHNLVCPICKTNLKHLLHPSASP